MLPAVTRTGSYQYQDTHLRENRNARGSFCDTQPQSGLQVPPLLLYPPQLLAQLERLLLFCGPIGCLFGAVLVEKWVRSEADYSLKKRS